MVSSWSPTAHNNIVKLMMQSSPKLHYLADHLDKLKENPEEKLLLWYTYPISQWMLTLVSSNNPTYMLLFL